MAEKKDYSETLNLPKTNFEMRANLTQKEPALIEKWMKEKLYLKICEKNSNGERFIFHDGPPYANAHIHMGTALNKILKDFIIKYYSMSGNFVPFIPGWDCHGLPIEQIVLKEMNTNKRNANKLIFRKQAAIFAKKFVEIQKNEFKRLGIIANWDHPYLTLDHKYEASIVKVFGQLVSKGYIYRKNKPVHWCPTCETAVADAELEYLSHISNSIFVKFKVTFFPETLHVVNEDIFKDSSVLVWTTTPWTIPANVALAFSKETKYIVAIYEFDNLKREKLIIAKNLAEEIKHKIKAKSFKFIFEAKGIDFVNIKCQNPLLNNKQSQGIVADFVSTKDGTGVVHIATGHGYEDYQAGLKYNLEILSPIDDRGFYTKEVPKFKGISIFDANILIVNKLLKEEKILATLKLEHSYPYCWRCKKPIIIRATPQWFVSIEHNNLRSKLLESIDDVNWVPKYGKTRIAAMLKNRPDWCISRQRLWGVPIPVFYCKKCSEPLIDSTIINKISNLFKENGSDLWFEMNEKELLDGIDVKCSLCACTDFVKEHDILDVWFDSGASYEAVLSNNNYDKNLKFPADLYLEGSDQHRGWFQTSMILSSAIKKVIPYKNVLTHGFVVDGHGKKMSKSLGNVISSEYLINKYGADVVRLWIASSNYKEDIRISDKIISGLSDVYRKIRNTIRFLLGNLEDFNLEKIITFRDMQDIDKYALSKLQQLISRITIYYKNYEFHKITTTINNFCTIFLSGFYLDVLKDTLYCGEKHSKERMSSQTAMFEICSVITRLLAPILSFTAEEVWKEIRKFKNDLPQSVFLTDFPTVKDDYSIDISVIKKWEKIIEIRKKIFLNCEKLRQSKIIGSDLEACLYIRYGEKYNDIFKDIELVKLVFGNWDIEYKLSLSKEELLIRAEKSEYSKCARCWKYVRCIKNELCPRCQKIMNR
ncbi:MAG: isoleucine--tRNA ligase [Endomicrobium sp.]|jgi:isoleucyl-tRNA synthetase|nr:isoleucine--tRNA ligase [Endomicrobium sp.]